MLASLQKVKEIGRIIERHIYTKKYKEIAVLFSEHWGSKMDRDPDIATPEMQEIWDQCLGAGALGGKLIGLGGGGYFLMYSTRSLEPIGGIPIKVAPTGAEIVHISERQQEVYA